MSHTVSLKTKVKDRELFKEVARRKGYKVEENARVKFFSSEHRGLAVYLPNWKYPVVVEEDGTLCYDNYEGTWGEQELLDDLFRDYVQELVLKTALEQGYAVLEQEQQGEELVIRLGRL
jgi:hypothetical protein